VLICDERPIARQTLTSLLTSGSPHVIIDVVADEFAVVDAFTRRPADLVLIGVHRGKSGGTQAVDLLLGVHPAAPVVVFGPPADSALLITAVSKGVRGIMLWDINHPGRFTPTLLGPAANPICPDDDMSGGQLTDRELQILRGMSLGHSNKHIGRNLFLSEDTIKSHTRRVFVKLGARDRAHAVALGLRSGLLT
jgi:DNA-binding NarL/FixJ family response regulator